MGIDVHTLNLLRFSKKKQEFGRVATIGRQGIHIPNFILKDLLRLEHEPDYGAFCENLLKSYFKATIVESFDFSDYEKATHIVDMNKPISVENEYDTIIDGGTTEHVYNVPQALDNISKICAVGGQILHILPANNYCGHGFWQFSPELFFSLYSDANGYEGTQVFLADAANNEFWYEVKKPEGGRRAEVTSSSPLFVLARTRKVGAVSHETVQQSDYLYVWDRCASDNNEGAVFKYAAPSMLDRIRMKVKKTPLLPIARAAKKVVNSVKSVTRVDATALSPKNPNLTRIAVASVV